MQYVQLAQSGIHISAVTYGVVSRASRVWKHPDGKSHAIHTIHQAITNGITTFDTAPTYGFGWCDRVLGQAVANRRDKVQISAKFGQRWDCKQGSYSFEDQDPQGQTHRVYRNSRPQSVVEECETTLKNLKTDYVDLYQCHWPDPTTPITQTMAAVEKLIKQGKVLAAGISNCSLQQIKEAHATTPLAFAQLPYSMLDRKIEYELMPWCKKNNISILAYSPLQSGLLASRTTAIAKIRQQNPHTDFNNSPLSFLFDTVETIATEHDTTPLQVILNWTRSHPTIISTICGASSDHQLEALTDRDHFILTEDQIQQIELCLDALTETNTVA